MDDLKAILSRILKSTPHYEENRLKAEIFAAWPRVVGDRIAQHCWPVKLLDGGLLLIAGESNAWLQSLRYLELQIIEKFEKELKARRVTGLRFKLDTRRPEA